MKRLLLIFILFLVITCIILSNKKDNREANSIEEKEYRSIFISYIDYAEMLKNKDDKTKKDNLNKMINNIKKEGFNTIIIQVHPFSDSIYYSSIFPSSHTIYDNEGDSLEFDILDYIIKTAKKKDLYVFSWFNPYRIRSNTDISSISKDNPAYKWLNTSNVKIIDEVGIFYNPASNDVKKLIISGIKELSKYNNDGIIFDDYFYPSNDIDVNEYNEYLKSNKYISLEEFHLLQVNTLIKEVYKTIKEENPNTLFGISPEGNIDNNYTRNYADVKKWLTEDNYIDFIMPQLYYGFNHEIVPFNTILKEWDSLISNNTILIPALALYKSGEQDYYAKKGINEWIENTNIIKRQIESSKQTTNYKGYAIYRYDYYFNYQKYNKNVELEVKNISIS